LISCPNCDSIVYSVFFKENGFEVLQCSNCFSIFSNFEHINHKKNDLNAFADTDRVLHDSIKFYNVPRFLINRYAFKVTSNFDFEYISKQIDLKKIENSLDIGSQYGFLVKKLRDVGIDSHGVEAFRHPYSVCDDYVKYEYFTENYETENKKYDLIIMGDIIHINPNSIKLINKSIQMLNDNGFLMITGFNPATNMISDVIKRAGISYQNYTSEKGYKIICEKHNCSLVNFSTFIPKLFSITLTKQDKFRAMIELTKSIFRINNGFQENNNGFRSYVLMSKNKSKAIK
jgi:hypothetical protein